ncbi:MAG: hypothetical protein R2879_17840 [Saprospiraceae bacterium]
MKFLLLQLLLPVFGFSQAPKKAEKIIIETNLSQDQNYQLIGQVLLANDIELAETIKDFGIIKTEIMENDSINIL